MRTQTDQPIHGPARPREASTMVCPRIEADSLRKQYVVGSEIVDAVRCVSFICQPGECVALLGANGAGKSTVIQMLATVLRPDGGQIRLDGLDIQECPRTARARIGAVLQDAALPRRQTPATLVYHHARLHGMSAAAAVAAVERNLTALGLVEVAQRRISSCSGGQRRRLDLALALLHEPKVLVLDEPCGAVDPEARERIWSTVRSYRDRGTSVVFSTQDMHEADTVADRILLISEGELVMDATPGVLKQKLGSRVVILRFANEKDVLRCVRALPDGALATGPCAVRVPFRQFADIATITSRLHEIDVSPIESTFSEPTLDDLVARPTVAASAAVAMPA